MRGAATARRLGPAALKGAIVLVISLALALSLGELAARATGAGRDIRDHGVATRLEFAAPCLRVEGSGDGRRLVRNPTTEGAPTGAPVPLARRPGVTRLAFVGESNAAILGDALRDRVGSSLCRGRCEVLSCGGQGAAVESVTMRFEEVLAYRPDVVVLIFGHNFRYSFAPPSPRVRPLLGYVAAHGWTRALLRSQLFTGLLWRELSPAPSDDATEHGQLAFTEAAITRMAAQARARGVRLLATTMASNLLMPPALPPDEPDDPVLIEARYLEAADGREAALRRLAQAPETAARAFQRGAWLLGRGRADEARPHLERARDLDDITPRAPEAFNDFLRDLSARGRVDLWDNARAMQARAPLGVPGGDVFQDCCHLSPGALEIALREVLARALATAGTAPCALPDRGPVAPDADYLFLRAAAPRESGATRDGSLAIGLALARRFALDGDRADVAVQAFLRSGARAPAARGETLDGIAWAYREAGRAPQAWQINAEARAIADNATAWLQYALWLVADHRVDEARAAIARAVALDGQRPDARYVAARLAAP